MILPNKEAGSNFTVNETDFMQLDLCLRAEHSMCMNMPCFQLYYPGGDRTRRFLTESRFTVTASDRLSTVDCIACKEGGTCGESELFHMYPVGRGITTYTYQISLNYIDWNTNLTCRLLSPQERGVRNLYFTVPPGPGLYGDLLASGLLGDRGAQRWRSDI